MQGKPVNRLSLGRDGWSFDQGGRLDKKKLCFMCVCVHHKGMGVWGEGSLEV